MEGRKRLAAMCVPAFPSSALSCSKREARKPLAIPWRRRWARAVNCSRHHARPRVKHGEMIHVTIDHERRSGLPSPLMRLEEIAAIIRTQVSGLEWSSGAEHMAGGPAGMRVRNVHAIRSAAKELLSVHWLKPEATAVLAHPIAQQPSDEVLLPQDEAQTFERVVGTLRHYAEIMVSVLDRMVPIDHGHRVDIRIPEGMALAELPAFLSEIAEFIDRPLLDLFGTRATFVGVDRGTSWFNLEVATDKEALWIAGLCAVMQFYFFLKRKQAERLEALRAEVSPTTAKTLSAAEEDQKLTRLAEATKRLEQLAERIDASSEARSKAVNVTASKLERMSTLYEKGVTLMVSAKTDAQTREQGLDVELLQLGGGAVVRPALPPANAKEEGAREADADQGEEGR